jgi:transcriptional regulator with XRE-family HTH domain
MKKKHWLSQHLEPLGWSSKNLAHISGIPEETVDKYLQGKKPSPDNLLKIARSLHIEPEFLFREAGVPYPKPDAWKKKIIIALAVLILTFTAFVGGLLLGVTSQRAAERPQPQATETAVISLNELPETQASQAAPLRPHRDDTTVRAGAWEQIEAATLCKSPSPDNVYILIDPLDALAEIWIMACPDGEDESYRVVYTPTVSGTTTIVTKIARP